MIDPRLLHANEVEPWLADPQADPAVDLVPERRGPAEQPQRMVRGLNVGWFIGKLFGRG